MKKKIIIFMISILIVAGCIAQQNTALTEKEEANKSVLDHYRQFSEFTDPGDLAYLYEGLPDSLSALCQLIKSQTIHPYVELRRYRDQIPKERTNEDQIYPTVKSMLHGLLSYDSLGLICNRLPAERLLLGCRHNAILLASILKYRGVPARIRTGHVNYLRPGFKISHTICEVWNDNDKRWMLVDPSTNMIDFSREKFEFSNELWLKMQNKEIDLKQYGFPGRYTGLVSILGKISPDLAAILGTEYPVYRYAPILDYAFQKDQQLSAEHIEILNRISELMKSIDASSISKLRDIYNNTPEIQITKSFYPVTTNTKK